MNAKGSASVASNQIVVLRPIWTVLFKDYRFGASSRWRYRHLSMWHRKTPEEICQKWRFNAVKSWQWTVGGSKKTYWSCNLFFIMQIFWRERKKTFTKKFGCCYLLNYAVENQLPLDMQSDCVCSGCQIVAGFSEWPLIVTVALRLLLPYQLKASAAPTPASVILTSSVQRQHCMGDQSGANLVCTQSPLATLAHSAHDNTSIISVAQSDIGSDHTCPWHWSKGGMW